MTSLEVSSTVNSILAAFTNGMDVFTRMGGKKHRRDKKVPRMTQEELRLHDSLSNRPKEIKAEYAQSVARHGRKFERGDAAAYSSLAHTLLVLNTGLINIINHALSTDTKDTSKSRQSLLDLSEAAGVSTLYALGQLNSRLSVSSPIDMAPTQRYDEHRKLKQIPERSPSPEPSKQRPPPSPLLARGGWVRTKSGSSVVSAASARKHANQQEGHRRSKSTPTSPRPVASKICPEMPVQVSRVSAPKDTCSCQTTQTLPQKHSSPAHLSRSPPSYSLERPPSMLLVPSDYFTENNLKQPDSPPPRPPKIPHHVRPNPSTRPRPPSAATFMTASTKIGEIPEDRWPDRVLSEEDQARIPLPYVIPPPLESPQRKRGGFKLWKRPQRKPAVTAH